MNQLSFRILSPAVLVTALHGLGDTVASAQPEHVARIAVIFVKPENLTDARRADFKPNSDALLDALAKFMQDVVL